MRSNVDRLFAIWQAINPDSYVQPEPNLDGTFVEAPGTIDTVDTRMSDGLAIPRFKAVANASTSSVVTVPRRC